MKLLFATITLAFFVAVLCEPVRAAQVPAAPAGGVTNAEYQVLSAYITSEFTGDKGEHRVGHQVSKIVIGEETQTDLDDSHIQDDDGKQISWKKISKYLHTQAPGLQVATLDSFRYGGAHQVSFGTLFHVPVVYELVDKAEIDAIFEKGGWWTDYYKRFPNSQGFLTLSRVGFSPDGKQALFYAKNGCGGTCGTGTYVVMERADSGWKVLKEILIWVS